MDNFALLLVLLATLVALLLGTRSRAAPFHITFVWLTFIGVGYFRLSSTAPMGTATLRVYVVAMIALAAGYVLGRPRPARAAPPRRERQLEIEPQVAGARRVVLVYLLLVVYHFSVVGIPLLSPNSDLARYDFTGSGLFGLPGRALLYGLPLGLILADVVRGRVPEDRRARSTFALALGALVASGLLSGFKGDLLQVLVLVLFLRITSGRPWTLGDVARRYGGFVVVALTFALAVSFSLVAVQRQLTAGHQSAPTLLVDRMTKVAAEPGAIVIRAHSDRSLTTDHRTLLHDAGFYLSKYVPGFRHDGVPFTYLVSGALYHRNPYGSEFLVPVTTGAIAEIYFDFGSLGIVVLGVVGFLFGRAEAAALSAGSTIGRVVSLTAMVVMHYALVRGDTAFNVINWGTMLAFTLGLFAVASSVGSRPARELSRV